MKLPVAVLAFAALIPGFSGADCVLAWDYDDPWASSVIAGFKAYQNGEEIGVIPASAREATCLSINAVPGVPLHLTAYTPEYESGPSDEVVISLPEATKLRFEFRFEVIVP